MGKETSQITEMEALITYARMLHTLDLSEFESSLSEDFSYSSQKVLTDMNSKDEFIEYIRPKLKTIKKSKSPVYDAEIIKKQEQQEAIKKLYP